METPLGQQSAVAVRQLVHSIRVTLLAERQGTLAEILRTSKGGCKTLRALGRPQGKGAFPSRLTHGPELNSPASSGSQAPLNNFKLTQELRSPCKNQLVPFPGRPRSPLALDVRFTAS